MNRLSCTEVEAAFVDEVDGRLDPAAGLRLHAHLERCAACSQRADLWQWLIPELRVLEPEPIDALAARRMQVEIERQLAGVAPARSRRPAWLVPATLAMFGAAAALLIWARVPRPHTRSPAAPAAYATVARLRGTLTAGATSLATAAAAPVGAPLILDAGGEAELALARGTTLTIEGPAHLRLTGDATAVAVLLDQGEVRASVAHRQSGETFAVVTPDLRVAVKGTRFSVTAGLPGSRVHVDEGAVAVAFTDGRTRTVSAGQTAGTAAPSDLIEQPEPLGELVAPPSPARPALHAEGCPAAAAACQETTEAVRASMRGGDPTRALRVLAERGRPTLQLDPRCGGPRFEACQDDLRYLHAEALNQSGRLDDAVVAYRTLDRRGAPPVMRQNALFAAAQIERRRGRNAAARADYERALGADPRGGLREEALIGAIETASAAGDRTRARALAGRYLSEFPGGLAAATARRLATGDAPP